MAGLLGAIEGIANPEAAVERKKMRLADQLARQRESDIEWKRLQTEAIEKAAQDGSMTWREALDRISETWGDHKGNKDMLKEHAENVHGINSLFDKVKHVLFPPPPSSNPLNTGTYKVPQGHTYDFGGGGATGTSSGGDTSGSAPVPMDLTPPPSLAPPPTTNTLSTSSPLVFRHKVTGDVMHSLDGGQTWKPGQPQF